VGVEVMQASDGDVLYAHDAKGHFNPASNTKILTTAAALSRLGSDFSYVTALYGPAPKEGVIHGDLILRGSGDPSLVTADLADLGRQLANLGVSKVDGNLIVDPRFRKADGAVAPNSSGAVILNRNAYQIRIRPSTAKHAPSVRVEPESEFFVVDNRAVTVARKRTRLRIEAYTQDDRLVVTVRGRISDRSEYATSKRLGDGARYAGYVLRGVLTDFGIALSGSVRISSPETLPSLLAEHHSPPLSEVCRLSNKPSNNFVAEAIFRTLGGELYGQPGSLQKGARAVAEYLSAIGIPANHYKIINGSGLTYENWITATDLATILRKIFFDLATAPEFMSSLAVAGIDGTIRNRFNGTDAVGLVRAKTGTLNGISALSGYVGDKDDVLIFAIFVQGFRHRLTASVRHAQVRLVQAMFHFLRDEKPAVGSPPNESAEPESGIDFDSEGEPEPAL
jgi:D-alanyl-D-alanine carboxypeptidase/D-alanyl-D-alanine-endopeptidase (penicillin-binding protein 4)